MNYISLSYEELIYYDISLTDIVIKYQLNGLLFRKYIFKKMFFSKISKEELFTLMDIALKYFRDLI